MTYPRKYSPSEGGSRFVAGQIARGTLRHSFKRGFPGFIFSHIRAPEGSPIDTTFRRERPHPRDLPNVYQMKQRMMSPEFKQTFIRLGLEQYLPIFIRSGFGDWHLFCNITESDFALLGVKLGHRRKLQREIARRHLWPDCEPLPADGIAYRELPVRRSRGRGTVKGLRISKL
jgi:hypothetical protein